MGRCIGLRHRPPTHTPRAPSTNRDRGLEVRTLSVGPAFTQPPSAPDGLSPPVAASPTNGHPDGAPGELPRGPACVDPGLTQDLQLTLACFQRATEGADVSVVDGSLGVLDGVRPRRRSQCGADSGGGAPACSTAEIARALGLPLVLVVDVAALPSAASIAALLRGYGGGLDVAGLVLNRVGGADEVAELRAGLEAVGVAVPVVAALPDLTDAEAASSGGGWGGEQQQQQQQQQPGSLLEAQQWGSGGSNGSNGPLAGLGRSGPVSQHAQRLSAVAKRHLSGDLDLLLSIARRAAVPRPAAPLPPPARAFKVVVGVAYDQAFYQYFQQ